MVKSIKPRFLLAAVLALALLAGCRQDPEPAVQGPPTPEQTVKVLAGQLLAGDLAGYARTAVPPSLHAELETAWSEDRSRWPLSEMPLAGQLAPMLASFSAEGSEARLQASFDSQFAGKDRDLDTAAGSLSLFAAEYVGNEGDYSDGERTHYTQIIEALGAWAIEAPLADREHASQAIARLAAAARATGIDDHEDFAALGMTASLEKVQPFIAAAVTTLARYGLDLEASVAGLQATIVDQDGDHATVAVRYPLAGREIRTEVAMERINGRWYPAGSIANGQAWAEREASLR